MVFVLFFATGLFCCYCFDEGDKITDFDSEGAFWIVVDDTLWDQEYNTNNLLPQYDLVGLNVYWVNR